MIWVPIVSLGVGALLAQRFKIVALLPATLAIAILAFVVTRTQTTSALSILLIIVLASVCMQTGYFVGLLVRRGMGGEKKLSSFSQTTSARDSAR